MNTSSSFEVSSETLEKSFCAYEESSLEDIENYVCLTESACAISEIRNPVKKKVNQLAQLQVNSKLSSRTVKQIIPILNDIPGASIAITNDSDFIKNRTEKCFETIFYAKCSTCNVVNICPGKCDSCKKYVEKKH